MNIGPTELLIILVVALIVFGPRKLPELGKSLGHAMAQFRRASDDFKRSWEQEVELEKNRLNEIKQDIGSGLGYDSGGGDDFNYSMDPNRSETELASSEPASAEEAGEASAAESTSEDAVSSEPEPATATIARSSDSPRSEPWI